MGALGKIEKGRKGSRGTGSRAVHDHPLMLARVDAH